MARLLSHVASVIRGSVGGLTYTANRKHAIVARARVVPSNPKTTYQVNARAAFAQALNAWYGEDGDIRAAWETYANSVSKEGPLGKRSLSGREAYIGTQSFAILAYQRGLVSDLPDGSVPIYFGWLPFNVVKVSKPSVEETGFEIFVHNFSGTSVNVTAVRSNAQPATHNAYKGPLDQSSWSKAIVSPDDDGLISFYNLTEGLVYFVVLRAVLDANPYMISTQHVIRCIAQEGVVP